MVAITKSIKAQCDVAFDPKMWIPEKVFLLRVTQLKRDLLKYTLHIDTLMILPALILKIVCSALMGKSWNETIFKSIEFFESHPKASTFKRNSLIRVTQM